MYNGVGYKRDEEQTQEKERKIKIKVTDSLLILQFLYCLILCNKQKMMKSVVGEERERETVNKTKKQCVNFKGEE